jgi:hypothetical protein
MTSKLSSPLALEHLRVLRVVANTDLTTLGTIVQQAGDNANGSLMELRDCGYVSENLGRQSNGMPTMMYSISAKGKDVRNESENENAPRTKSALVLAVASSTQERPVYMGHEMRAFAGRTGAMDAFRYPSRVGGRLYHRDGTVTLVSVAD